MKKNFKQTAAVFLVIAFACASCKKDDGDPTPKPTPVNPPAVNQPSTTAPSLNSGTSTSLNTTTGSGNSGTVNLSDVVTDPQGDAWTITSIRSSNTAVATIEDVSEDGEYAFKYTGVSAGTTKFTIVVTDANGNANTLTYTITITQAPNAPTLNSNVNKSLYVQAGSNVFWDLSDKVTDPQDDSWTVTGVVSSNTAIVTVRLDGDQIVDYTGVNVGTATITVTLADDSNNTSTFTATVNVAPKIGGPK